MLRSLPWIVALLGVSALGASACTSLLGDFSLTSGTGGGPGVGGGGTGTGGAGGKAQATATSAGSVGGGGSGGSICKGDEDCTFLAKDCLKASCTPAGTCVTALILDTFAQNQIPGDCKRKLCDGVGMVVEVSYDKDPPDDGNPCTSDACADGQPTHGAQPIGSPCADPGNPKVHHCDGKSTCVECTDGEQCPLTGVCFAGACVPDHCFDSMMGDGEPDVDCGGPCLPCSKGQNCFVGTDCESFVCDAGTHICQGASCLDGVKNDSETDVDCGGNKCMSCQNGKACSGSSDCKSNACVDGVCVAPSCSDGLENGLETDIDCGGAACDKCGSGKGCNDGTDCMSASCTNFLCQ